MMTGQKESTTVIGVSFHGIGAPPRDVDPADEGYFVTQDLFLNVLDEIAAHPQVDLSFDDGFASDVEIVLPALLDRGLSAKFFPVAGRIGRPGYLDKAGIRALSAAGMTIGSHGMRHRSWRGLDADTRHEELILAQSMIAEAAAASVTAAACPFGAYDRKVLRALRHYGYTEVLTSDCRRAQGGAWLQPRYTVIHGDTLQTFRNSIMAPPSVGERMRRAVTARVKAWR